MQITINLPDNLSLTEVDDRGILTPPDDPDDDPNELILAHLRISLQQIKEGKVKPISELWDGIDV